MNDALCENIVDTVRRLIADGFEAKRAWATALFYTVGSPVEILFNHKDYGVRTGARSKDVTPGFVDHVTNGATTWFAGAKATRPKERMLAHSKLTFEAWHNLSRPAQELVEDALNLLALSFAHDSRCGGARGAAAGAKKVASEGGPKMFFMASPWQMLNTIPQGGKWRDRSIKQIGNVAWPGAHNYEEAWLQTGQEMKAYPTCSAYVMRSEETIPADTNHEYSFTLDVDGINALTKQEEKTDKLVRDELCEQVVRCFQENRGDVEPAILVLLTDILVDTFGRLGASVSVSWHKTIGYKPSWRAYVVGAAFRDNYDAKAFVEHELKDRCLQMFRERLPEPFRNSDRLNSIVDCGTYGDGWDRCLGSAKLNSCNPEEMRFLHVKPLTSLTDPMLLALFNDCPNRYILTVLGWVYPEEVYNGSRPHSDFFLTYEPNAGTRTLKRKSGKKYASGGERCEKRVKLGHESRLSEDQNKRLSDLVANSLHAHGFVHPSDSTKKWRGEGAELIDDGDGGRTFKIAAAPSEFMLCVYKNCRFKPNQVPKLTKAIFDAGSAMHSSDTSGGKIIYQISLWDDKQPWIKQNCFKCGGEFGHNLQFICETVLQPGAPSILEFVMGATPDVTVVADAMELDDAGELDDDVDMYNIANVMVAVGGKYRSLAYNI
jgi:hypothetical protein